MKTMLDGSRVQRLVAVLGVLLALGLAACGGGGRSSAPIDETSSDVMYSDDVADAEFYVLQIDGKTITVENYYDVYLGEQLQDGCFYKVVADVTYLNGGVAGYVDFPQVKSVKSIEQVSPFDMGLPSVREKTYGLLLIGDYADGDVLFNERGMMAVWQDGGWVRTYNRTVRLEDGTVAGVREGVSAEDVEAGTQNGILSCEDYFALLPDRG